MAAAGNSRSGRPNRKRHLKAAQAITAKTKIAIVCQGGGSQTAFTAGALKALCEARITDEFEIVSMSGTSGGAVCAVLVWHALERGADPPWRQLMDFWQDNSAIGWAEIAFNQLLVESVRMINNGLLPTFQLSPSSSALRSLMQFATMGLREKTLLEAHIDFAEIASWGPRAKRPVLMVGAANLTTGRLTKFISNLEPIRVEHVLAHR
jgi:NTE family protein